MIQNLITARARLIHFLDDARGKDLPFFKQQDLHYLVTSIVFCFLFFENTEHMT